VFLTPWNATAFLSEFLCGNKSSPVICDIQFSVNKSTLKAMHRSLVMLEPFVIKNLFPVNPILPEVELPDDLKLFNQVNQINFK
jgi:hypothetical protein